MFCWNCGKEIEVNSVFCPSCGCRIKQEKSSEDTKWKKDNIGLSILNEIVNLKEPKVFIHKVAFLVLVLITFYLSKGKVFEISDGFSLTMKEFARYGNRFAGIVSEEEFSKVFGILYTVFRAGMLAYVVAAVIIFFNKNGIATGCTIVGFVCNVLSCFMVLGILQNLFDRKGYGTDVLDIVLASAWGYFFMNIAILIYSIWFFPNMRSTYHLTDKDERG